MYVGNGKFTYHLVNIKQIKGIDFESFGYVFTYHLVNIKQSPGITKSPEPC